MSISSGTVSLFASAAFFIAAAAGAAYGIKHKEDVKRAITELTGKTFDTSETMASADAGTGATYDSDGPGDVTLRATSNGHFETSVEINGRDVDVMVDTGATLVAMTFEDAERAGIYLKPAEFTHTVSTANGIAKVAPIEIESISLGDITVRNVRGAVAERGKLHRTLLGMTFLGRLSRVEMRKNALVLHE